jgi:hypothetical protein
VRVVGDDPLAERLDRIIARLSCDDRRWPLMLRRYYGSEATTYEQVAEAVCREYGDRVSGECVRRWMREAEATIRGELRAHQSIGA